MDFKLPNITIATDASPSSNEGYVEAKCVFNGVAISSLATYTPASWSSASHAMAATHAVIELKKKIARLYKELGESGDACAKTAPAVNSAIADIIGKTVRLKSGGLTMTASALGDDGGILCVWADVRGVWQQSIPLAALEAVAFSSSDGWMAQDGVTADAVRDLQNE